MVTTRSASKGAGPSGTSSPSSSTTLTRSKSGGSGSGSTNHAWAHAPSAVTLFWMAVSLPLVVWDSVYVLLRPLTMEGGALHWPLWTPYALYGEVDHVYGWKAFRARSGFTSAQGALNVVETLLYAAYLWLYFARRREVRGRAPVRGAAGAGGGPAPAQVLTGRPAAGAVLIAFSAAVMTLSKTVLYWLNEYFSGFDNIGHNDLLTLVFMWIIPNGAWLVFPTYMIYVLGGEIIEGLTIASTGVALKSE